MIGHEPDFQYWATMNTWALDEATALSLDFEPTGKVLSDLELPKPALQVAAFYARRRKVLENNLYLMAGTNIPAITPTPLEFCQWTIKADLEIPTGLLQAVSHTSGVPLSRRNLPSPTATNDPALDPRERTNLLLRLIPLTPATTTSCADLLLALCRFRVSGGAALSLGHRTSRSATGFVRLQTR